MNSCLPSPFLTPVQDHFRLGRARAIISSLLAAVSSWVSHAFQRMVGEFREKMHESIVHRAERNVAQLIAAVIAKIATGCSHDSGEGHGQSSTLGGVQVSGRTCWCAHPAEYP